MSDPEHRSLGWEHLPANYPHGWRDRHIHVDTALDLLHHHHHLHHQFHHSGPHGTDQKYCTSQLQRKTIIGQKMPGGRKPEIPKLQPKRKIGNSMLNLIHLSTCGMLWLLRAQDVPFLLSPDSLFPSTSSRSQKYPAKEINTTCEWQNLVLRWSKQKWLNGLLEHQGE